MMLRAGAENAYLGDGLAEQIITVLGSIGGLQVAARTSSFAIRNRELDARAIGDTLGMDALLEGSVRVDDERFRVTVHLVDTNTGYRVWTRQYDRELADAVTVQDEIVSAIAAALELRFAGRNAREGDRTQGFAAYDVYLRGLFLRNDLSAQAMRESAALFDRAIAIEPGFAAAWAAKASVTATQVFFGYRSSEAAMAELLDEDPAREPKSAEPAGVEPSRNRMVRIPDRPTPAAGLTRLGRQGVGSGVR